MIVSKTIIILLLKNNLFSFQDSKPWHPKFNF